MFKRVVRCAWNAIQPSAEKNKSFEVGSNSSANYTNKATPRLSILDKRFKYVNSSQTDLRRKFARIRQEQAAEAAKPKASVREIKRKAAA